VGNKEQSKKSKKLIYYPYRDFISAQRCMKALSLNKCLSTHQVSEKVSETRNAWPEKRIKNSLLRLKDLGHCKTYRTIKAPQKHQCSFQSESTTYVMDYKIIQKYLESVTKSKEKLAGKITKTGFIPQKIRFPLYCNICGNSYPTKFEEGKDLKEFKFSKYEYWELTHQGTLAQIAILNRKELLIFVKIYDNLPIIKFLSILEKLKMRYVVDTLIYDLKLHVLQTKDLRKIAADWFSKAATEFCNLDLSKQKNNEIIEYQEQLAEELKRKKIFLFRRTPENKFPKKFWYPTS